MKQDNKFLFLLDAVRATNKKLGQFVVIRSKDGYYKIITYLQWVNSNYENLYQNF